jgi:tripartite-type tricarboxylate transporter receptor subunit TctC
MMKARLASAIGYVAIAASMMVASAPGARADDFYAGKQVTFIVGAGVGGGYDLQARLTARHLGKHIPGKPTIVRGSPPAITCSPRRPRTAPPSRCCSAASCSPS